MIWIVVWIIEWRAALHAEIDGSAYVLRPLRSSHATNRRLALFRRRPLRIVDALAPRQRGAWLANPLAPRRPSRPKVFATKSSSLQVAIAVALVAAIFTRYDGWIIAFLVWTGMGLGSAQIRPAALARLLASLASRSLLRRSSGSFKTPCALAIGSTSRAGLIPPRPSSSAPRPTEPAHPIPAGTIPGSRFSSSSKSLSSTRPPPGATCSSLSPCSEPSVPGSPSNPEPRAAPSPGCSSSGCPSPFTPTPSRTDPSPSSFHPGGLTPTTTRATASSFFPHSPSASASRPNPSSVLFNRLKPSRLTLALPILAVTALFILTGANAFQLMRHDPIVYVEGTKNLDARLNYDEAIPPFLQDLLAFYPRSTILMDTSAYPEIVALTGIPLRQTINEGDLEIFRNALAAPASHAPIIVAFDGDDIDRAVTIHPSQLTVAARFTAKGQPSATVYVSTHWADQSPFWKMPDDPRPETLPTSEAPKSARNTHLPNSFTGVTEQFHTLPLPPALNKPSCAVFASGRAKVFDGVLCALNLRDLQRKSIRPRSTNSQQTDSRAVLASAWNHVFNPGGSLIPFTKAHACGNDFLIVPEEAAANLDRADLTRRLCARNTGVGADGVEFFTWLESKPASKSPGTAFRTHPPLQRRRVDRRNQRQRNALCRRLHGRCSQLQARRQARLAIQNRRWPAHLLPRLTPPRRSVHSSHHRHGHSQIYPPHAQAR